MKITTQDYNRLNQLITDTVKDNNIMSRSLYPGMTVTSYIWDIFHSTCDRLQHAGNILDYLFIRSLYDYCNDNNINTALKNILKKQLV